MLSVAFAVVLAVGASGSSPAPGQYLVMGAEVSAATPVGQPRATTEAPASGTVTRLHWEILAAGTNGAGSTFTLAVTADDVVICSASIACTAVGSGTATCTGAFTEGQDLHVEVTASSCAAGGLPSLMASTTMRL